MTIRNPGNREDAIQRKIASWPPQKYHIGGATFANAHQHATVIKTYSAEEIAQGAKTGEWTKLNKQNGAAFILPVPACSITPLPTSQKQ